MSSTYTIEVFLKGLVNIEGSDEAVRSILFQRGIEYGTAAVEVSERLRDLSLADMYMWAADLSPVNTGTKGESDGGWQHYETTKNVYDRAAFRAKAMALYAKWNEDVTTTSGLTMKSLY